MSFNFNKFLQKLESWLENSLLAGLLGVIVFTLAGKLLLVGIFVGLHAIFQIVFGFSCATAQYIAIGIFVLAWLSLVYFLVIREYKNQ